MSQVFDLIVVGLSNKEIARTLGLSQGTVRIQISKLFGKLGVRHRSAVALAGTKLGLRGSQTFSRRNAYLGAQFSSALSCSEFAWPSRSLDKELVRHRSLPRHSD